MAKQAHVEIEKNKTREDAETKAKREFREQVLFSNDIGLYLLRINDSISRVNAE